MPFTIQLFSLLTLGPTKVECGEFFVIQNLILCFRNTVPQLLNQ